MKMNYATLKQLAKETPGVNMPDLVALATQNDPFSCGSKGQVAKAEWFRDLYRQFGISDKVHLRRIHYWAMSQPIGVVDKPGGTPYENTDRDWEYLVASAKYARYLGLVDMNKFHDKRNTAPRIQARFYTPSDTWAYVDPTPKWELEGNDEPFCAFTLPELPAIPDLPGNLPDRPSYNVTGYDSIQQDYLIEIWSEKSTMDDIIHPLCDRYRVNYCTGQGELSISMVMDFLKRVASADRPARIIYVSDYDPAGLGMPVSIARKIEWFIANFSEFEDLEIKLEAVVMTADQVAQYNLPRKPIKDKDMRKANWIKIQGAGGVELDALEALYPGELKKILRDKILCFFDTAMINNAYAVKMNLVKHLDGIRDEVKDLYWREHSDLREQYSALRSEYTQMRERFAETIAPFQEQVNSFQDGLEAIVEVGDALWEDFAGMIQEYGDDPERLDMDAFKLPEPELTPENPAQLYSSEREYLDQLLAYKQHRGLA